MKRILQILAVMASSTLLAQDAEAAATQALTLKDIIVKGGDIMYVLVALSIVAVMLIVFYCLALRKNVLAPVKFVRAAQDAAEAGDIERLRELANGNSSSAAKIVASACEAYDDGIDAMRNAMEEEGARQVALLWSRIQYLMDVGTISPMVGLLGTVWGMMVSFLALDTDLNMVNKVSNLTSGVSQAMFTTFGGLIVGILSIVAYSIFRGHLNKLTGALEGECAGILRRLRTK
ncbi:MAG: MotA/TolQ/ExbB proton channel family protein [Lentisphaeria bacterium]|nr:MotA/TolQ/ExbB proton channel family protein [Lentisphaeria bacterium]